MIQDFLSDVTYLPMHWTNVFVLTILQTDTFYLSSLHFIICITGWLKRYETFSTWVLFHPAVGGKDKMYSTLYLKNVVPGSDRGNEVSTNFVLVILSAYDQEAPMLQPAMKAKIVREAQWMRLLSLIDSHWDWIDFFSKNEIESAAKGLCCCNTTCDAMLL